MSGGTHTRRSRWLFAVCLALAVQSLYPAGYMPASLASGWPIMLCPDGLPTGFLDSGDHHSGAHHHGATHDHRDGGGDEPTASDGCALGKALQAQAMLPSPVDVGLGGTQSDAVGPPTTHRVTRRPEKGHRARAPPTSSLI